MQGDIAGHSTESHSGVSNPHPVAPQHNIPTYWAAPVISLFSLHTYLYRKHRAGNKTQH